MVTEEQITKFLEAYPDLEIDTLYRMLDGDRRDRRRALCLADKVRSRTLTMQPKRKVCESVKGSRPRLVPSALASSALERIGAQGGQRTIDKELWAWRIR